MGRGNGFILSFIGMIPGRPGISVFAGPGLTALFGIGPAGIFFAIGFFAAGFPVVFFAVTGGLGGIAIPRIEAATT